MGRRSNRSGSSTDQSPNTLVNILFQGQTPWEDCWGTICDLLSSTAATRRKCPRYIWLQLLIGWPTHLKKNTNAVKLKSSVASCDIPEHAWESNWNKVSVESLYVTLTVYRLQILFSGNHAPGKISYQVRKDTTLQTPSNLGHSDFWLNPVQRRQTAQNVNSKQTNTVNQKLWHKSFHHTNQLLRRP